METEILDMPYRYDAVINRLLDLYASYGGEPPARLEEAVDAAFSTRRNSEHECELLEAVLDEWTAADAG